VLRDISTSWLNMQCIYVLRIHSAATEKRSYRDREKDAIEISFF
jgi:hypothetical protein